MDRSNKPVAKKLALKEGKKLRILNSPQGYAKSLGPMRGVTITTGKADVVQVFATSLKELENLLRKAKASLNLGGMIWVTYPKGNSKIKSEINRDSIREYVQTVGLDTVALVAIDDDWSALRCRVV